MRSIQRCRFRETASDSRRSRCQVTKANKGKFVFLRRVMKFGDNEVSYHQCYGFGFNGVPGSGFGFAIRTQIRIQEGKNNPQILKKVNTFFSFVFIFYFWSSNPCIRIRIRNHLKCWIRTRIHLNPNPQHRLLPCMYLQVLVSKAAVPSLASRHEWSGRWRE